MLALSDLTAEFTTSLLERFANAFASLGLFDRVYTNTKDLLDALEVALVRVPSPSPFAELCVFT